MKLLCDHQIFSSFRYSGISRYFAELFQEFPALGIEWRVSAYFTNNAYLQSLAPRPAFLPDMEFRGKNRILETLNLFATRRALAQGDFDVFHSTYSKPYDRKLLGGKPYVITVHDMTHEKLTDQLPSAPREVAEEKGSIANADAIIVPSYATRDDLVHFYPEAAKKITVIYHGFRIPKQLPEVFTGFQPYCIYVGTRALYKDFPTALRAFAAMPEPLNLLCVGGGAFTEAEQALFGELNIAHRVKQAYLTEPELFAAYKNATMLLFPSQAEGFGLPTIEAQSQGCVPVLAATPCSREIGGNGALYFDPGDSAGCAAVMKKLLSGECDTRQLKRNMAESILRFNWRTAAEKTAKVYQSLLK